ncbi:MAG: hypothetical protein ACKVKF_11740 [Rhodobacterales bacterium]
MNEKSHIQSDNEPYGYIAGRAKSILELVERLDEINADLDAKADQTFGAAPSTLGAGSSCSDAPNSSLDYLDKAVERLRAGIEYLATNRDRFMGI